MTDVNITALKFDIDFYTVDVSQYVGGYPYNSLTFINYGSAAIQIDSIILQPNQQFEIIGNVGEVTSQRFFVNLLGATGNVVIVRKRYLNL